MTARRAEEPTYSLGAVARLTGVSPATLRAWERRYEAVSPLRTEGGTRRYRERDVSRLRLLKAAVEAGNRIGDVARLDDESLRSRAAAAERAPRPPLDEILEAFERLDAVGAEDLLAFQLSALGPVRFVGEIAYPILQAIGSGWEERRVSIAAEHLATALLRSFLGAALRSNLRGTADLRIVFGTPTGERHELGLLAAALGAVSAGIEPVYLGPDLPVEELVQAVEITDACALALSIVNGEADGPAVLRALRDAIPGEVEIWVGGSAAETLALPEGVLRVSSLDEIEERVALLRARAR